MGRDWERIGEESRIGRGEQKGGIGQIFISKEGKQEEGFRFRQEETWEDREGQKEEPGWSGVRREELC